MSLRHRLVLLIAAAFLPAVAALLYVWASLRQTERGHLADEADRLAQLSAANVGRQVEGVRQLLTAISMLPEVQCQDGQACSALFADLLRRQPVYANIGAVDLEGRVFASGLPSPPGLSLADRAYFRDAVRTGAFAVGEHQIGRITGKASINFAVPTLDDGGRVRCVVFAAVDLSWLQARQSLPRESVLLLLDRRGTPLLALPDEALATAVGARGPGRTELSGRLVSVVRVPGVPEDGMTLALGLPVAMADQSARPILTRGLVALAIGALAALLLAWMGSDLLVARPARALLGAVERHAAGDLAARAQQGGGGELGRLAQAFDRMAGAVQGRQEALQESERRFRALVEEAPIAIGIVREGRLVQVNAAGTRLLGYDDPSELVGRPFLEATVAPESREQVEAVARARARGEPVPAAYEHVSIRRDGTRFPVLVQARALRLDDGPAVIAFVTDLTERRRAEERFQAAVEQSPIAIGLHRGGVGLFMNSAFMRLFGFERAEDGLGRTIETYLAPSCRERVMEFARRRLTGAPAPPEYEAVGRRTDGSEFPMNVRVAPVTLSDGPATLVFIEDLTEKRRAEEALRTSEQRFRSLVEESPIAIGIHRDGVALFANEALARMVGRPREEILRSPMTEVLAPSCREEIRARGRRREAGAGEPTAYETVGARADGTEFPLLVQVVRVAFHDGPATVLFFEDLTEQRRAERALRESEERLRQTQKMEAIGRLAGGVAHDFNNLLQVIGGFADTLRLQLPPGSPLADPAEQIVAASARAAGLVRQLLAFSRRQVVERRVLDLNAVVRGALDLLRRLVGVEIELITDLDADAGRVRADRVQLEQVLLNLSANARDAMPRGGRLIIATRSVVVSPDEAARTSGARPGPHAVLEVADTGEGMDAETLAHLFEPFFTTKAPGSGTGLGLATVYGVVSQCEGHLRVESEPGRGTRFRVLLPNVDEPADETPARPTGGFPGGTELVLVVEDDPGVLGFLTGALRLGGYRVLEASSPAAALKTTVDREIDLLVTDVIMAGGSGPDLASRLRASRPSLRVLFVSGHTADERVPESELLRKPFDAETLLRRVRSTLDAAGPS